MDVSMLLNVILCHGRNHQGKNVRYVAVIWLKRVISYFVQQKTVDIPEIIPKRENRHK